ncbi:transcription termination factor Rho [Herbidospora mongoliensis]|uniref:transcription termination factor Rho n=1 Tax=Herbidospora mongoliensis TaxID=688067 RepID=UPI0009FDE6EB|nr:transcription termination factor Rho [Herbidospora mongoliensis]
MATPLLRRTHNVGGILDGRHLRVDGYLRSSNDVVVPPELLKGLRQGDVVHGTAQGGRLVSIDAGPPDERPHFAELTPVHPEERLRLETNKTVLSTRVIDLLTPIGKGQRGLIVAPPKAGKTLILKAIANAISANHPDVHLMVVLIDERPEEVTDMRESVRGEVIASTFDRPPTDHITVIELAVERAKRLVEQKHDVVLLIDSITRVGRAYNMTLPGGGKTLSGGIDVRAIHPPKRVLGAARKLREGGSLTIIATALVETGSKMDDNLFEEFKSTGNMELRLSRALSEKRVFPAVDVTGSGTRREELLFDAAELPLVWRLRKALHTHESYEPFLSKLKDTGSNAELLLGLARAA